MATFSVYHDSWEQDSYRAGTCELPARRPLRGKRPKVLFPILRYVFSVCIICSVALGTTIAATTADDESTVPVTLQNLTDQEREWLKHHPVISVAQDPNWPPVEFINQKGEPSGMSMDYLQLIEKRLGVRFTPIKNLSWQEAYSRLKSWQIDITMSVTVTEERKKFWAFTEPYMHMPIVIAAKPNVTFISGLHELAGEKVAVVDGYALVDWLPLDYPNIQLVRVKTALDGLRLLEEGKVFAYIDNQLVIGYLLAKHKGFNLKIAGETQYMNFQCIAVRKDWSILVNILEKALKSISESERQNIYRKWLPIRYDRGFDYSRFWQILAIFFIILGLMVWWVRRLSLEIRNRKLAEATLRESERKFRDLFHKHSAVKLLLDPDDGRILDANEAAAMFYGWPAETLRKMNIKDINTLPEEKIREVMQKAKDNNRIQFEFSHRTAHGETKDVEVFSSGINLTGKTVLYSIVHDITEKRKLEDHLLQAQKIDSVGRLAGGVAHDFNNMLNVIQGYTEMALAKTPPTDIRYDYLAEILKATGKSTKITRQLLAFARQQSFTPTTLDLNETIAKTLQMLQRLIGEDIELVWLPAPGLCPIQMDPIQIDQILTNLCVNARDAIRDIGKISIETSTVTLDDDFCLKHPGSSPGDFVLLTVRDNGSGMSQETLKHIFEPFFTTKKSGEGTGLGLATVYGIVKQNNGHIIVNSEPEHGTTIKIYFPASRGSSETAQSPVQQSPVSQGHGETVLLVEDEPSLLHLCQEMLKVQGYSVLASASPREAIRLAMEHRGKIQLLLTDVVMPEMNGRVLADQLLQIDPRLKIIFMSGYTSSVISHRGGLTETGSFFIQKPFSQAELAKIISQAMSAET